MIENISNFVDNNLHMGSRRLLEREEIENILALHAEGLAYAEIAQRVNRAISTVRYICMKKGQALAARCNANHRGTRVYGFGVFILPPNGKGFRYEQCIIKS